VEIAQNGVKAEIKGRDAVIEVSILSSLSKHSSTILIRFHQQGTLLHPILHDDSTWALESTPTGGKGLRLWL
jgi:hypothetical protein